MVYNVICEGIARHTDVVVATGLMPLIVVLLIILIIILCMLCVELLSYQRFVFSVISFNLHDSAPIWGGGMGGVELNNNVVCLSLISSTSKCLSQN